MYSSQFKEGSIQGIFQGTDSGASLCLSVPMIVSHCLFHLNLAEWSCPQKWHESVGTRKHLQGGKFTISICFGLS